MPMWKIYHPEQAFSIEDKQQLATAITALYATFLPRFYVNVLFRSIAADDLYIGGQASGDFVRITIDHIARAIKQAAAQQQFLDACSQLLAPYVQQRGLRWELHVNETSFDLWRIDGLKPPMPDSAAEARWKAENRPSVYSD
jgi:phenylpyruvate tautomerase PptA (4-oxalocrotonate tautomerase family)